LVSYEFAKVHLIEFTILGPIRKSFVKCLGTQEL
jgi:hypothetical protein